MNKTGIEYLDYTWSPIAMRCTPIAAGCKNCWHIRMCGCLKENHYSFGHKIRAVYAGEGPPRLVESRLNDPLKVKKPSVIGTQFMGDLWHEDIDWPIIDKVFYTCHKADHHKYVFLTKRIEAAWYYFNSPIFDRPTLSRKTFLKHDNILLGVSVSTQADADKLIPILLEIPAAVRIVSVEPMLEPVDMKFSIQNLHRDLLNDGKETHWVICGCESGPKRRPCKLEWIESLVQQCVDAGVPVFVKQAEINGKVVSMPKILGRVWDQLPKKP